jgi:hypothetical protein
MRNGSFVSADPLDFARDDTAVTARARTEPAVIPSERSESRDLHLAFEIAVHDSCGSVARCGFLRFSPMIRL